MEKQESEKRKRKESSDLDNSKHYESEETESPIKLTKKQQKRLNQKAKKAKIEEETLTLEVTPQKVKTDQEIKQAGDHMNENHKTPKDNLEPTQSMSIEKDLKEIKDILKGVLTKDDPSLKKIITETIKEMKEDLLKSLSHRIEILEGDLYSKETENENLKKEIELLKKRDETKHLEQNGKIDSLRLHNVRNSEAVNELEQYQRRNNLRVSGLSDTPKEDEENTAEKLCDKLNEYMPDLELDVDDIDIAHRLGKFTPGKNRTVIVRFISRRTRNKIIRSRANLKGSDIFINEDLTKLNQEVLSSVRLKRKQDVEYAYTHDGKLFVKWKKEKSVLPVLYKHFNYWLDLSWPKPEEPEKDMKY